MLKKHHKITKYLYRIIDAGINIKDIFYHDISGINVFIIDEELINDSVNDAIDFIIEDSESYYDIENSLPYINIISMPKQDIVSSSFDTAEQGIYKKYNILLTHDEIMQVSSSENVFDIVNVYCGIEYTRTPKKQVLTKQSPNEEVELYKSTGVYQQQAKTFESSHTQGKQHAYAA